MTDKHTNRVRRQEERRQHERRHHKKQQYICERRRRRDEMHQTITAMSQVSGPAEGVRMILDEHRGVVGYCARLHDNHAAVWRFSDLEVRVVKVEDDSAVDFVLNPPRLFDALDAVTRQAFLPSIFSQLYTAPRPLFGLGT